MDVFLRYFVFWNVIFLSNIDHVTSRRNVSCFQCNVYNQGHQDVCGLSQLPKHNCTGCLKTFTRAYIHDQWMKYKYISHVSRYCMQVRNYELPEGCYTTEGVQSYVRRCYCYSHWCNHTGETNKAGILVLLVTAACTLLSVR